MGEVANFPLPPEKAVDLIRGLYRKGKYRLPEPPGGPWQKAVVSRQMMACLEGGDIHKPAVINERGHYEYELRRLSAGVMVVMNVVLLKENEEWVLRIVGVHNE